MSRRELHGYHPQPRPFTAFPGTSTPQPRAYYNPYSPAAAAHNQVQAPNRPGLRHPFDMPNMSSLTSSALINALITPSANEHEQNAYGLQLPTPFSDSSALRARSSHTAETLAGEDFELTDQDDSVRVGNSPQSSPTKKPARKRNKKLNAVPEQDHGYTEDASVEYDNNSQSPPRRRRSTRPRKVQASVELPDLDEDEYELPHKETKPKRVATVKKTKKERPGRLIRKKPIGMTVPKSLSEAGPADRMMWEWKNQGRNWEEIRSEWKRITGVEPGGSSLSVRYIKLVENLARNSAAGDIELLRFRKEAEEELLSQLWEKVAEKMLTYSPESEHNPKDLQKRYNMIVRSGYDVEKLLAEDKLKQEAEEKREATDSRGTNYEDEFDMAIEGIGNYNDPVANVTAAYIRENEQQGSIHQSVFPQYPGTIPSISESRAAVYPTSKVLRNEVDGHNEQEQLHNRRCSNEIRQDMKPLMSSAPLHPTSLFMNQKEVMTQAHDTPFAPSYSLIPYHSDSE